MPTIEFAATDRLRLGADGVIPKQLFDAAQAIDTVRHSKCGRRFPFRADHVTLKCRAIRRPALIEPPALEIGRAP